MVKVWGLPIVPYRRADGIVSVTNRAFLNHMATERDKRLIYRGPENDNKAKYAIES